MILERIGGPQDIAKLSNDELLTLCREIRTTLVDRVQANGGHLGSNLGVVELTVAIHLEFKSPSDKVIWDTGHQSYVHKLLTGRRDAFRTLRKRYGLSGFPDRAESGHDWVENSHASMALSYAHGFSLMSRHTSQRVVAVVGDGALTGGVAYEALSNIGHAQSPVIVVLNDNGRSYAPTVSRLTAGEAPHREVPQTAAFFEALGFRYIGPTDGHDLDALRTALGTAAGHPEPTVVHVLTRKGKGYAPAELDTVMRLHNVAPMPIKMPPGEAVESFTRTFGEALVRAGTENPRVHAITAAMAGPLGMIPFAHAFPDRYHDVGIAEQHAVGLAAGLAMSGARPVLGLAAAFLARAIDQIHWDIALHGLSVTLCVDRAGINSADGPSGQGVLDIVLLTSVPNLILLAPSSAEDLQTMLSYALTVEGPCAIRYPKVGPATGPVGIGSSAVRRRRGTQVCVIPAGRLVGAAETAAELIERRSGESVTIWDPRALSPLDPSMIEDALRHHAVLTVEDGYCHGGLYSLIGEALTAAAGASRLPILRGLGVPREFLGQAVDPQLMRELRLDAVGIAHAIIGLLQGGH